MKSNRGYIGLIVIFAIVIIIGENACSNAKVKDEANEKVHFANTYPLDTSKTNGQILSYLDFGKCKERYDPYTVRADSFLDALSKRYQEPQDTIIEYVKRTKILLGEYNVQENSVDLMDAVNQISKIDTGKLKIAMSFVAFVDLSAKKKLNK